MPKWQAASFPPHPSRPSRAQKVQGPVFAHAGMVAAAKAIFRDMTERGILQELVQEEDTQQYSRQDGGDGTAAAAARPPPQQGMERAGSGGQGRPHGGWKSHFDEEADRKGAVYRFSGRDKDEAPSSAAGAAPRGGAAGGSAANVQSQERGGAAGRLWQGTTPAAARQGDGGGGDIEEGSGGGGGGSEEGGRGGESPSRCVGNLMRQLIEQNGWQLVVQGHR